MKRFLTLTLACIIFALSFTACTSNNDEDGVYTLRMGLVGDHQDHWRKAQELLLEQGINLEFVFFTDFMTPNRALNDGDIDINAFQHHQFFNNDTANNNYQLTAIGEMFYVPLNLFKNPARISSLEDITDGMTIAVPSDAVNYGRALRFLEQAGLLALDTPEGILPTELDIVEFIVNINIITAESGMLAQILPDVDAAIINTINAFTAGLRPQTDSILQELVEGENRHNLTNLIAIRTEDYVNGGHRMQLFETIVNTFRSDVIRQVILDVYQGALVPVF